ncbi:MAG: DUF2334 domain-containing protein [Clostridiales bacterium]|nr:DUF2334 domain-containing protein [Clostridiales bacterium]
MINYSKEVNPNGRFYKIRGLTGKGEKYAFALFIFFVLLFTPANITAKAAPAEYVQMQALSDVVPITVTVNNIGVTYDNIAAKLYSGRLYLPLTVLDALGKVSLTDTELSLTSGVAEYTLQRNSEKPLPNVLEIEGSVYVNAFGLANCFNMVIEIDSGSNIVNLYRKSAATLSTEKSCSVFSPETEYKTSYLRLEDIMADGVDTGGSPEYTDRNLMVFIELIDILYQNNQKFYAAWIPVYVNPATGCINNLITNRNLYNADFLGTLDYISARNGKIGLHGYTHQYGSDKSSIGWEWGSKTHYSEDEQESRFVYAKNTAEMLGIDYYFFEFPHYGITDRQAAIAEKYFNVIYQKYSSADNSSVCNHNGVLWVPTPADYIHCDGYVSTAVNNIKNLIAAGNVYSIYYHPTLDFNKMQIETSGREIHIFKQGYTNLYYLINETQKLGYSFGYFN